MTSPLKAWEMAGNNMRNPSMAEPRIFGSNSYHTPAGVVRASPPPPLPPRLAAQPSSYSMQTPAYGGMGAYGGYSSMGGFGSGLGYGGMGGYGNYAGGYGGYGGNYGGGYGSYGGGFNRFGSQNPSDPENRFIQIAEDSSRSAFASIESLVGAIGNIAMMLDSTFFALTSSFRAILGVAANFGRLRSVFSQFWMSFALFRGLNWMLRKILYILRLSNMDPSSVAFKEAFAVAQNNQTLDGQAAKSLPNKPSSWPVLLFLGFIMSAPYLIMKMLGTVSEKALEETRNPQTWVNPIRAHASYDFASNSPGELSFRQGQKILVAPKDVQNTQKLLNTGWVLASLDNRTAGLIPVNYIRGPKQMAEPTTYVHMPSAAPSFPDVLDTALIDNDPPPGEVPENLFDENVLN